MVVVRVLFLAIEAEVVAVVAVVAMVMVVMSGIVAMVVMVVVVVEVVVVVVVVVVACMLPVVVQEVRMMAHSTPTMRTATWLAAPSEMPNVGKF